jgi:hypothetical protein
MSFEKFKSCESGCHAIVRKLFASAERRLTSNIFSLMEKLRRDTTEEVVSQLSY